MKRVTLDFYNNVADINVDGVARLFTSGTAFKELTGFNFPDALLVSYEYERNFFMVERVGGVYQSGASAPEIQWITDNIETIKQAAATDELSSRPTSSWRYERNTYLGMTDWMVIRHNEELLRNATTLTTEQFEELLEFRYQLRIMTDDSLSMPAIPAFVPVQV